MSCPVCQQPFTPVGRRRYCTDACRAAAYRRRHDATQPTVLIPKSQPRRPLSIYECPACGTRNAGEQRCEDCNQFMRRVGYGGCCPSCDEPITVNELLGQQATP
jgi:hypothetical protein